MALSDAEVAVLALGVPPIEVQPDNLVFYAPLWRDEDLDLVGGYTLTATGSPTTATHPEKIRYAVPSMYYQPTAAGPTLSVAVTATDETYWTQGVKVIG